MGGRAKQARIRGMLVLARDVVASWLAVPWCRRGTVATRGAAKEDGGLKEVLVLVFVAVAGGRAWARGVGTMSAEGIVLAEGIPEEAFGAGGGTRDGRGHRHGEGLEGKKGKRRRAYVYGDRGGKGVIV